MLWRQRWHGAGNEALLLVLRDQSIQVRLEHLVLVALVINDSFVYIRPADHRLSVLDLFSLFVKELFHPFDQFLRIIMMFQLDGVQPAW